MKLSMPLSSNLTSWNHSSSLPMIALQSFSNLTMSSVISEIQENPIIVTAMALIYVAFLIAFIIALRKDHKDKDRPPFIELFDNFSDERYRYLVTVYTGNRKRAGPTSTVAIQIIGRKSTKVHLLQEYEDEPFLLQGTVTTFLLTTKSAIGDVNRIRLWHHNEGSSPGWYVERVIVQDYETKEAWLFPVNSWLSDHLAGAAKIDIIVPAASMKELHTFRSLFSMKFGKYLKERHMWYSSFVTPPWSINNMTRVNHLACCMLLVFMIMVTALAFYSTQGSSVLDLGFYSFQWLNIAIGIQSCIICFPVPYAVSSIFSNSRERIQKVDVSISKLHEEQSTDNVATFSKKDLNEVRFQHSNITHPSGHQVDALEMQRQTTGVIQNKCTDKTSTPLKDRLLVNPVSKKQQSVCYRRLESKRKTVHFCGEDVNMHMQSMVESKVQMPSAGKRLNSTGYKSRRRHDPGTFTIKEVDPTSSDCQLLPWYSAYIGWAMVMSGVIFSTLLTLLYGMAYGVHISRQWCVSLVSGTLFSIYIMEPLKATALALVAVLRRRKVDVTDWIPPMRVPVVIRGYSAKKTLQDMRRNNPCYNPPDNQTLLKTAGQLEKRIFRRRVKDLSIHMVYLCILVLNAASLHDNRMFHHKNALSNMFQVGTKSWRSVKNYIDIYTWLEGPLLDTLYGGYKSHFTDGQLLVISPAVLRQQKFAREQPCIHGSTILSNSLSCKSRYDVEEVRHIEPISQEVKHTPYLSHESPWTYVPESQWTLPFWGEHDNYHSGGYIAKLGKSKRNATKMLAYLKQHNWIDRHSRLVMMETVLYNVALRFYCYVQMSFEITSRGKVDRGLRLMIMKPHYVTTAFDYITYISLFALLAIVFYFVYNMANLARETGLGYFGDFWHLLEISTLFSSVGIVVTYLSKANRTDLAMYAIKNGFDSLPMLYAATNLSDVFVALLGYCIFFTMIRTVAIMEGHHQFQLSYATMHIIRYELLGHLICLIVGFFAFYHSGLLLFRDMLDFSTLVRAAQSVVAYAAGAYMSNLLASHPLYGGIYCFLFFIIYGKLFVNFFICILENAFRESKLLLRNIRKEDFVYLTRKQIRSLFVLEGRRRVMKEMKAKSDMEKSEERIYAEVLKIKFAREHGVSFN